MSTQEKTNPALGLISKSPYTSEVVSLDDIDRLLIFTDGLHEVEDAAGDQMGIDQIITTMENGFEESLENSLDTLLDKARRHSVDGEFEDDVCLFAMDVGSGL